MVRLKEVVCPAYLQGTFIFQFLYGAIKSLSMLIIQGRSINFNSCMVRLKGCGVLATIRQRYGFQFLYGAIKRRVIFDWRISSNDISIPVWCD